MAGRMFWLPNIIVPANGGAYVYSGVEGDPLSHLCIVKYVGGALQISLDGAAPFFFNGQTHVDTSFTSFTLTNNDTIDANIALVLSDETFEYTRNETSFPARIVNCKGPVACPAGAQTKIHSANRSARAVLLTTEAAAGPVRWGDSSVSATVGLRLNPGQQPLRVESGCDLYVWNDQAASVTVSVMEELF